MINKKKLTALSLSLCIVLGSNITVNTEAAKELTGTADSYGINGTGTVEGYVDQGVMRVVLPSVDINYVIDPMGLIKATDAAAYKNAEFDYTFNGQDKDDGFVFFVKKSGSKSLYSTSMDLSFQNKSSFPVKARVTASFECGDSNMVLTDPSKFDGSKPGISFSVKDDSGVVKPITQLTETTFLKDMPSVKEAYNLTYSSSGYVYTINPQKLEEISVPQYNVSLIGQCDPNADWSIAKPSLSALKVTWYINKNYSEITGMPSIKTLGASVSSTKLNDIILSLDYAGNSEITVKSVSYKSGSGGETYLKTNDYSVSGSMLTINSAAFKSLKTGIYTYKVIFSNNISDTVQIEIK